METIQQPHQPGAPPPFGAEGEPQDSLRERVERAAAATGVEGDQVERLPFDLSILDRGGIFINVDTEGFGVLDQRLKWDVLGIKLPEGNSFSFRAPRMGVLPEKYRLALQRPAHRAHTVLTKHSYRFKLTEALFQSSAYRWVPVKAFTDFEEEFAETVSELEAAKQNAVAHYDEITEEVRRTFTELAIDSARRYLATTGESVPENFTERVVEGAVQMLPTREQILGDLSIRYTVGVFHLGSEMLAEKQKAVELRASIAESEAEINIAHARERVEVEAGQMHLTAERERIESERREREEEMRREAEAAERIRNLKLESAREQLASTINPLMEGAAQLHATVYEACVEMKKALQDKQFVPGATAKRARELTRWFRLMNFQNDEQLERLIGELNRLASKDKKDRSPADLNTALGDLISNTYALAQSALETDRLTALEI